LKDSRGTRVYLSRQRSNPLLLPVSNFIENVEAPTILVCGDAAEFVGSLKQQQATEIRLIGRGELARPHFWAGLIDGIGFNIRQRGAPLFAMDEVPCPVCLLFFLTFVAPTSSLPAQVVHSDRPQVVVARAASP
jgi:hypothetical protein